MKSIARASILALSLLWCFTIPHLAAAQTGGTSANGSFKFSLEDGLTKYIEFNASTNQEGSTTGRMTFSGPAEIPVQDVDGTGRAGFSGSLSSLYIEAVFDGLVVERNRAVMSGVVTGSNLGDYIGRRVLLAVEDNGDCTDPNAQDKITCGLYETAEEEWVPTDAEWRDDNGALLTWIATDAERRDDVGVPSNKSKVISCQSFPLSSYSFEDVKYGDGDIQVRL